MSYYTLTLKSQNRKTGPMTTVIASRDTCPSSCPLQGKGCYAEARPLRTVWDQMSTGKRTHKRAPHPLTIDELCDKLKALPVGTVVRYGVAGDLPGCKGTIDKADFAKLFQACKHLRVMCYTHKPFIGAFGTLQHTNQALIGLNNKWRGTQKYGLTINVSANSIAEADRYKRMGVGPVVVLLPKAWADTSQDKYCRGRDFFHTETARVKVCPAVSRKTTCDKCMLCWQAGRKDIIGFPAHGPQAKHVEQVIAESEASYAVS